MDLNLIWNCIAAFCVACFAFDVLSFIYVKITKMSPKNIHPLDSIAFFVFILGGIAFARALWPYV